MTGTLTTRRVFGAVLGVVAAGLGVTATFLSAYTVQVVANGRTWRFEATSWVVERDDFRDLLLLEPLEFGEPAVAAALVMALSAVLAFRVPAVRVGSLLGAGVLAGILFLYVFQLRELKELIDSEPPRGSGKDELLYHDGFYLLLIAAAAGLVGAVLAQRRNPEPAVEDEDEGDGVVVHQLDSDDDTPPFGIAIPDDDERETR